MTRSAAAAAPELLRARRTAVARARRIVVKIGTRVLTDARGAFDRAVFSGLVDDLCALAAEGREVVVVTSGAIGLGVERLGLARRPTDVPGKQAAAAVGQALLMRLYDEYFSGHGRTVAQVLLTHADVSDRTRYLNARHTLFALLGLGAIPVINENDTVAVEEIKFGDNDHLSALVAGLVVADLLVVLTDTEGLYSADPRKNPGAVLIPVVERVTAEHTASAGPSASGLGTGGMSSKVSAVSRALSFGVPALIAGGKRPRVLASIFAGENVGTYFLGRADRVGSRKVWIGHARRVRGVLTVDAGAARALRRRGASLLPAGVVVVDGAFQPGDAVSIRDQAGVELARGLAAYAADDLRAIRGRRAREFEAILGFRGLDEAVHRDDLILMDGSEERAGAGTPGDGATGAPTGESSPA